MIVDRKPLDLVVLVGDIHAGMESNAYKRFEVVRDFFLKMLKPHLVQLVKDNPDRNVTLILEGDTFDIKQQVNVVIANYMLSIFEDIAQICHIYVLIGNHDMPIASNPNINSVKALKFIPNIDLAESPTVLKTVAEEKYLLVPYNNTKEKEKEILEYYNVEYPIMHTEIAGFHYEGVPVDESKHNGIPDFKKFKRVRSGHIHKRQEIDNILFTGTPYHIRSLEVSNDTGYYLIDTKTNQETYIRNTMSPRYVNIDVNLLLDMDVEEAEEIMRNNYVNIKTPHQLSYVLDYNGITDCLQGYNTIKFSKYAFKKGETDNVVGDSSITHALKAITPKETFSNYLGDTQSIKVGKDEMVLNEAVKNRAKEYFDELYEKYNYLA